MDLNEKIQARRNERKQQEVEKIHAERVEAHNDWVEKGGRKRLAKLTARLILLPIYALSIAFLVFLAFSINYFIN